MKTKINLIVLMSILVTSCSSLQQSTVNDDIYYSPKNEVFASNDAYDNASNNNKSAIINKDFDKKISNILEDDSKTNLDTVIYENKESSNPYDRIMVDNYSEAYEKRQEAMRSPSYGMNNSFVIYSDDYWYAQSFLHDPFYNVVIVGDMVWVEPYWVSSSFGYWPHRYRYGFGYGFYSPYSYYGSYYSPYYYSSYYRPYYGYYGSYYGHPYHWGNHYPHYYYGDEYLGGSSNYSSRRRSLASSSSRVGYGNVGELPETYTGRNIRSSSTVKSGLDRTTSRTGRSGTMVNSRTGSDNIARETIRVRETSRQRTGTTTSRSSGVRSSTANTSRTSRDNIGTQRTSRSTYNTSNRSTTRYSRPSSTSVKSQRSTSRSSGSSTYSPSRSGNSRSGSSYTPRSSSSRSSGSSVRSSSSGSSRSSSGSSRSSGSSSSRSSSSGRRR